MGPAGLNTIYRVQSANVVTPLGGNGINTATCNPGDKVLGGGHATGAADISVGFSYPDTDRSWSVALKSPSVAISWYVVAVCLQTS